VLSGGRDRRVRLVSWAVATAAFSASRNRGGCGGGVHQRAHRQRRAVLRDRNSRPGAGGGEMGVAGGTPRQERGHAASQQSLGGLPCSATWNRAPGTRFAPWPQGGAGVGIPVDRCPVHPVSATRAKPMSTTTMTIPNERYGYLTRARRHQKLAHRRGIRHRTVSNAQGLPRLSNLLPRRRLKRWSVSDVVEYSG